MGLLWSVISQKLAHLQSTALVPLVDYRLDSFGDGRNIDVEELSQSGLLSSLNTARVSPVASMRACPCLVWLCLSMR